MLGGHASQDQAAHPDAITSHAMARITIGAAAATPVRDMSRTGGRCGIDPSHVMARNGDCTGSRGAGQIVGSPNHPPGGFRFLARKLRIRDCGRGAMTGRASLRRTGIHDLTRAFASNHHEERSRRQAAA